MVNLLLVDDQEDSFKVILRWLPDKSAWENVHPLVVAGRPGNVLMERVCAAVRDYFDSGPNCDGAIVLDLNWGDGAATMGCDFVYWLRAHDYYQPILIRSEYVGPTGVSSVIVERRLPVSLGWQSWTESSLDDGWPQPLTEERMAVARKTALRLLQGGGVQDTLDRIWNHVRRAFYPTGTVNWEEVVCQVEKLEAVSDSSQHQQACQALRSAVCQQDPLQIRETIRAYGALLNSQGEGWP